MKLLRMKNLLLFLYHSFHLLVSCCTLADLSTNNRDDSRDHSTDNYKDRNRGKSNSRHGRSERRKHQRSETGQRYFDKNEFCNYCDITGHTTHRCFKLVDYLKRKGKKIISHKEEEVQDLAHTVQNLSLKLNILKVRTSTNY